jgi:conjugative transfer signal peptidase TraF
MKHRLCTLALLGIALLAVLCPKAGAPVIVWNASPSVPIGLYRLTSPPPETAALAVIRLPEPLRILAESRGYLRKGALLIKPVVGGAGDTVCRHGALVTINGRIAARARTLDVAGRSLPAWSGCFKLGASHIFVLSADPDSFDSRYTGPIARGRVVGFALPIWVRQPVPTSAPAAS